MDGFTGTETSCIVGPCGKETCFLYSCRWVSQLQNLLVIIYLLGIATAAMFGAVPRLSPNLFFLFLFPLSSFCLFMRVTRVWADPDDISDVVGVVFFEARPLEDVSLVAVGSLCKAPHWQLL